MTISRRRLRKGLIVAGCLFSEVAITSSWVGVILIGVGACLHWLSKAYLEQNRDLTTAGPYRWTRNPFYLANVLIDGGIVFVIGRVWLGVAYLGLMLWIYHRTIREEEERLRELFGARFEDYARQVPRLIPWRRPLAAGRASGRFDLRNPSLVQGREYARLLGIALAPCVIWSAEALRGYRWAVLSDERELLLGLILAVPALWIVKLGIAETMRRPEIRLLPPVGALPIRSLGALVSSAPLLVALHRSPVTSHWVTGYALVTIAVLITSLRVLPSLRLVTNAVASCAFLTLGCVSGKLWLALPASAWFILAALDELGKARMGGWPSADAEFRNHRGWSYLPRILVGSAAVLLTIAGARVWYGSAV